MNYSPKILKIAVIASVVLIVAAFIADAVRDSIKDGEAIEELEEEIVRLENERDSVYVVKYKTKIKWRVRNETEIKYIYISSDSVQLIIRDSLRSRYNQGR